MHRCSQVHSYMRTTAKPGIGRWRGQWRGQTLEGSVRALIEENGSAAGIAFPTGRFPNHIAAHWTPSAGA